MEPRNLSFDEIMLGDTASFEHTFTKEEVLEFAHLSGDTNPLHIDESYAATTQFGRPIVHGMLLGALCSRLVGMYLPGKRCLYLSQTLLFKQPLYCGEQIIVTGVVKSKSIATRIITVEITIQRNADIVTEGLATLHVLE
jgi:3-hydroxybutyryl-CoA dehydratase